MALLESGLVSGITPALSTNDSFAMLKISTLRRTNNQVVLLLEGRIIYRAIAQLLDCCENALKQHGHLTLDLSGVTFISAAGIKVLQEIASRQVTITNYSGFIAEQLKSSHDNKDF